MGNGLSLRVEGWEIGNASPLKEFEIVRGELAQIFSEASKDKAENIFGNSIASILETETCMEVRFNDGLTREYDIVVVAEGLLSRTRAMAFDEDVRAPIHSVHMYVVSSFDRSKTDDQWARLYNSPGRRGFLLRSDGFGRVQANAMLVDKNETTQANASSRDRTRQKDCFVSISKMPAGKQIASWLVFARQMDLYAQEVAQAKCKTWSKDKVVLAGDTALLAFVHEWSRHHRGRDWLYILAAEIVQHRDDHHAAFAAYEATFRPCIEDIQKILSGAPNIGLPETKWGIRILHVLVHVLTLGIKVASSTCSFALLNSSALGESSDCQILPFLDGRDEALLSLVSAACSCLTP